jgi:alpha-tubulin suppressor-like RCC1 family protein
MKMKKLNFVLFVLVILGTTGNIKAQEIPRKCGLNYYYYTHRNQNDLNNDGIRDICQPEVFEIEILDSDGDGIDDEDDNCPNLINVDQLDTDQDGFGNRCDLDDDGDLIIDFLDNCPQDNNRNQLDQDNDGIGDVCDNDGDLDNDGIDNSIDNCRNDRNPLQYDTDLDGIGDECDPNNDHDHLLDGEDNCPYITNPDQIDSDGNGYGDACENKVIAGSSHVCYKNYEGLLWCWGKNTLGQAGHGEVIIDGLNDPGAAPLGQAAVTVSPSQITNIDFNGDGLGDNRGLRFRFVTAGDHHTCALSMEGKAYCWGSNREGQLGNENFGPETTSYPMPIGLGDRSGDGIGDTELSFKLIRSSSYGTCGLTLENEIWCWGDNRLSSLLSIQSEEIVSVDPRFPQDAIAVPRRLSVYDELGIIPNSISAGGFHFCLNTEIDGNPANYCWGGNFSGQHGVGHRRGFFAEPVLDITEKLPDEQGGDFSCGFRENQLYCWGLNDIAQLGRDYISDVVREEELMPGPIVFPEGQISEVALGGNHGCLITVEARVYCWGHNQFGQLGISLSGFEFSGLVSHRKIPLEEVRSRSFILEVPSFKQLSLGAYTSCAIAEDDNVHCWGDNYYGQCAANGRYGLDSAISSIREPIRF